MAVQARNRRRRVQSGGRLSASALRVEGRDFLFKPAVYFTSSKPVGMKEKGFRAFREPEPKDTDRQEDLAAFARFVKKQGWEFDKEGMIVKKGGGWFIYNDEQENVLRKVRDWSKRYGTADRKRTAGQKRKPA